MIDWTQLDPDFLAFAKDMQDRYDGHGSFLDKPLSEMDDAEREAALGAASPASTCATVYARTEFIVSTGDPVLPDGGVPVKIELKTGEESRWAFAWLPSCAVVESEGMDEGELDLVSAYLKENAAAILWSCLKGRAGGEAQ